MFQYNEKPAAMRRALLMEVPPGFGPGIKVLQTFALPLGDGTK